MKELKINPWAYLVAIAAQFALGSLWFGPWFGNPWMETI